MSEKRKAPLMAQQIARAKRADRRRVDKEKLQQVITISINPIFNLIPFPGPIKVDAGVISSKLVKHPNSSDNFQEEWDVEKVNRELLNLPKRKGIAKRAIPEKLKLFLIFSPKYKKHKKGVRSEPSTPRDSSSNSRESDKESGDVKPESSDELGYISDTPIIHKIESLSSEFEETDQKVLYETPSQFLDSAIQIVSIELQ